MEDCICQYLHRLVIPSASTRPQTGCLHAHLPAGGGGGALHHPHPGVDLHLVLVEGWVGVELDRATRDSRGFVVCYNCQTPDLTKSHWLKRSGRLYNRLVVCLSVCLSRSTDEILQAPPDLPVQSYTANLPRTPNIFTDSGPPMYSLLGGLTRDDPHPPNPPYGGALNIFWGGIAYGTFYIRVCQLCKAKFLRKFVLN